MLSSIQFVPIELLAFKSMMWKKYYFIIKIERVINMSFEWPKEWRGVCKGLKPMNLSSNLKLLYCRIHYLKKRDKIVFHINKHFIQNLVKKNTLFNYVKFIHHYKGII